MFKKKLIPIILLITAFFSCNKDIYTNYKFRFKVIIPSGWIALNSGMDKKTENEFKKKLDNEKIVQNNSYLENYKYVEVAIYNPGSKPPLYEFITVKGENKRLDYNSMLKEREMIQRTLFNQLYASFGNCKNLDFNIQEIKKGKALRFEYIVNYKGVEYLVISAIVLGGVYGTYFVNGFCRLEEQNHFLPHYNNLLYNFEKF